MLIQEKIVEVVVVVSPSDYQEANGNLDVLRNAAPWQSDNHFKTLGTAALASATLGLSMNQSVLAGIVRQFHKDAIGK